MRNLTARAIAAALAVAALQGCGGMRLFPFDLPGFPDIDGDSDTFVLDWTGGPNALWPDGDLPPMDLSEFEVESGGTLADVEGFRGMVRDEVEAILHAADIRSTVVTGEGRRGANVVHFSPEAVDEDGDQVIGRGHFDPCNRRHADSCIVYAQSIIDDGLTCSVREWVNVFAGVAAHEIGHNLGFDHVDAADLPPWTGYVELMLAKQTWGNRRLTQRILVEQDTCPDVADAKQAPISMPSLPPPPE